MDIRPRSADVQQPAPVLYTLVDRMGILRRQQPAASADKDAFQTLESLHIQHIPGIGAKHVTPFHDTFRNIHVPDKALVAPQQTHTLHDEPFRIPEFNIHITADAVCLMRDGVHQKDTQEYALSRLIAIGIGADVCFLLWKQLHLAENTVQKYVFRLRRQNHMGT